MGAEGRGREAQYNEKRHPSSEFKVADTECTSLRNTSQNGAPKSQSKVKTKTWQMRRLMGL